VRQPARRPGRIDARTDASSIARLPSFAHEGGAFAGNVDFSAARVRVLSNILNVAPVTHQVLRCSVTLRRTVITFARRCDS
jgi:hypothetical protein